MNKKGHTPKPSDQQGGPSRVKQGTGSGQKYSPPRKPPPSKPPPPKK